LAAAGLVLLVACLNIANLLLARGAARAGELAVRRSMGAGRGRLLRQLLLESLLLAAFGAALSLPVGMLVMDGIATLMQGAGAETVVRFGRCRGLHASRVSPAQVLRSEAGGSRGGRGAVRFRNALAVGQVALSMAALVLAGLFLKSLDNLSRVDIGMQVDSVLTFAVSPARNGHAPERVERFYRELERSMAEVPGVQAVASSMVPLMTDSQWSSNVTVEGREPTPQDTDPYYNAVGRDFFRVLGIPLLAGRAFDERDTGEAR